MSIFRIVTRSFSESLQIPRFLPFFLLYLIPLLIGAIFMIPVLKVLPSFLTNQFSQDMISIIGINSITILIVFAIAAFVNLWFVGSLVHNIQTGNNFDSSLKHSSSIYWHLLAFSLIPLLFSILGYLTDFGMIFKIIFDILFFISIPAIVKERKFLKGMESGLGLVRKNILRATLMTILISIVNFTIIFALIFSLIFLLAPPLANIFVVNPELNTFEEFSTSQYVQLVGFVLTNYHYVFLAAIISAFFFSLMTVFTYTAKTYYFLHLSKKKF